MSEYDNAMQKFLLYYRGVMPSYTDTPGRQRFNSMQPQGISNSLDYHRMNSLYEIEKNNKIDRNYYGIEKLNNLNIPQPLLFKLLQNHMDRGLNYDMFRSLMQQYNAAKKDKQLEPGGDWMGYGNPLGRRT